MTILKLTDIIEMVTNIEYQMNMMVIAANLSGRILGLVKHSNEVSDRVKIHLLEALIDLHEEYPIGISDKTTTEAKELLNALSLQS